MVWLSGTLNHVRMYATAASRLSTFRRDVLVVRHSASLLYTVATIVLHNGEFSWNIHHSPLYARSLLLGVSVDGDST